MNIQDFTKQWEAATEALEITDNLQVRSALKVGAKVEGDIYYTDWYCNDNNECDMYRAVRDSYNNVSQGEYLGKYKCTRTWTVGPC